MGAALASRDPTAREGWNSWGTFWPLKSRPKHQCILGQHSSKTACAWLTTPARCYNIKHKNPKGEPLQIILSISLTHQQQPISSAKWLQSLAKLFHW